MGLRILPAAVDELRAAISENRGDEIFAIGDVEDGCVVGVVITCRGQADRVTALLDRPAAGQVVIHNHPSGDLRPSDADLELGGFYGQNGVGVVIVDNAVTLANWVVEPHKRVEHRLDPEQVVQFFKERLPSAIEGFEARQQQIDMALAVTACLNDAKPLVVEAGTGTGKSLAYLVPAVLYALANDKKVVISTFTRTLQAQLMDADVPVLRRAGVEARVVLLQGRNNYLCRRRLQATLDDSADEENTKVLLDGVKAWSEVTRDGSRMQLPIEIDSELWGRIRSDADYTLRARCPHFAECHYYNATREASGAHVVIVNHALLLADLSLRNEIGRGVLPNYDRLVLDEGHHLEDAATSVASGQVSARAVQQALQPLLDRRRRKGALGRLARDHLTSHTKMRIEDQERLEQLLSPIGDRVEDTLAHADDTLSAAAELLNQGKLARRVDAGFLTSADWRDHLEPSLRTLAHTLEQTGEHLEKLQDLFQDVDVPAGKMEPVLQVKRARQRVIGLADRVRSFLVHDEAHARWIEPARTGRREPDSATLVRAPIDVAETLDRVLWKPIGGVVVTSATLTVGGSFQHFRTRAGLTHTTELTLPSPFDHARQALLGLPRDLPEPNTPVYLDQTGRAIVQAVRQSGGGAFVLCTSYEAVRSYAQALRQAGVGPLLVQGESERTSMITRFLENRSSVLVGTDSFWEGVSVKGDALRLVIVPRIPFRVPTDPLYQARVEAITQAGRDPFSTYTLPEAVLKLRQGYGRLIRTRSDRGVVLLLDTRVHSRRYGRVILASLPPARRVKGPLAWVLQESAGHLQSPHDPDQNNGS